MRNILSAHSPDCCRQQDKTGLTPLGLAVSSFAPFDVIESMLKAYPESATIVDLYGATPLHIACLNGTTPDVVRLFLQYDQGKSVRIVDNQNYTVLHHAVEYACLLIQKRYNSPEFDMDNISIATECDNYSEIIQLLCNLYPEMIHFTTYDNNDSPLDIPQVLLSNIDPLRPKNQEIIRRMNEIYDLLKRTSIYVYKNQKKFWEESVDRSKMETDEVLCDQSLPSMMSSTTGSGSLNSNSLSLANSMAVSTMNGTL